MNCLKRPGVLGAVVFLAAAPLCSWARAGGETKPYKIENGRVDANTLHGYALFTKFCQTCHGPGGVGLTYPYMPPVIEMLKKITEQQFKQTVINGRQCGEPMSMPAFGEEPEVMPHLNDIYAYLRARSDGAIGPGRPKRIGESE